MTDSVDVLVVGAGPAGLSAALNLVRARRRVLVVDSNRPRNAATLASHGFLTRDGISPLELRRLGREEVESYPEAEVLRATVTGLVRDDEGFTARVSVRGVAGERVVRARRVVVAAGLREELPALPGIRAFYGTDLHSCIECDGYEKSDAPLALLGETDDLAERALLLTPLSSDLVVFTLGVAPMTDEDERRLAARGVRIERRPVAEVEGDRTGMTGVRLIDGDVIPRTGGFVRPRWVPAIDLMAALAPRCDDAGLVLADAEGRTSVPGLYAAGDITPPGPQQLIVAAGAGARVATAIARELALEF